MVERLTPTRAATSEMGMSWVIGFLLEVDM